MSAIEALKAAREAGVTICADGNDLLLHAPVSPTASVINLLARHKAALVELLRPRGGGWSSYDWREYFEERLAIAESRRIAWESCIARWRDLNPSSSDPSRCAWCGEPDEPGNIVPFGIDPYAWLHDHCWPDWDRARQAEAEAALRLLIGENIDDQ